MANAGAAPSETIAAVNTFDVLAGEYELIWPGKAKPRGLKEYYRRVQQNEQAALCLSGGGIRSASFALGVLQALSKKRLLTRFQYLSTVSGGGYIGGWLQRWIYEAEGNATSVMDELDASCRDRVDGSAEAGDATDTSGTPYQPVEPRQIKALRENSNYITPRVGISSNDTWTAISISVRNIAVNWLLFAPLLLLVTMVPNFFNNWVGWVGIGAAQTPELVYIPYALSLVCAAVAAWHTCRALPSYRAVAFDVAGAGDGWLLKRIVKWLVGWALFGTMVLWADVQVVAVKAVTSGPGKPSASQLVAQSEGWGAWLTSNLTSSLGFAIVSVLVALLSLTVSGRMLPKDSRPDRDYRGAFFDDFGIWVAAFVAAAVTIPVGSLIFNALSPALSPEWALRLFATLGPLWLMGSQLMIAFVFAAFRRNSGGTVNADADREWLARLSAVKIKQMLLWGVLAFTTLLLVHLLAVRLSGFSLSLTSVVALVSGVTAVFGGRGENTGNASGGPVASILRFLPLSAIISLATFVFVIALLTVFGSIEQLMAIRIGRFLEPWIIASGRGINAQFGWHLQEKWLDSQVLAHIVIALVLGYLLYRLDKKIPVNRFSLNGLYRNRLSRAFLGGARLSEKRNPDPFTGFDPEDNINVSDLAPSCEGARVLYPVVNVALNVTATKNLAWQERKAGPFILSPLYCGSDILVREGESAEESPGAYVSAAVYAGREPGQAGPATGISLATAISISGAAASPNMGYHSSAATAFLMTLFNVRLGAWLPNPAKAKTLGADVCLSSPSSSLRALLRELGGSTDDQGKDIYLSDGGHFENLALYEMIRRRCKYIVVSDAGADPNCDFADLGNAVRKVKIDLGADIIFTKMRISSRARPIDPQFAWALGKVCYGDGQDGEILYIKPSFYDHALPVDVVSYAKASESFPHESTGDQFFSESQFESYRKLGFTFADEIGKRADGVDYGSVKDFFDAIKELEGDYEGQEETGLKTGLRRWLGL